MLTRREFENKFKVLPLSVIGSVVKRKIVVFGFDQTECGWRRGREDVVYCSRNEHVCFVKYDGDNRYLLVMICVFFRDSNTASRQ